MLHASCSIAIGKLQACSHHHFVQQSGPHRSGWRQGYKLASPIPCQFLSPFLAYPEDRPSFILTAVLLSVVPRFHLLFKVLNHMVPLWCPTFPLPINENRPLLPHPLSELSLPPLPSANLLFMIWTNVVQIGSNFCQ